MMSALFESIGLVDTRSFDPEPIGRIAAINEVAELVAFPRRASQVP
jgi:hypothetical protein